MLFRKAGHIIYSMCKIITFFNLKLCKYIKPNTQILLFLESSRLFVTVVNESFFFFSQNQQLIHAMIITLLMNIGETYGKAHISTMDLMTLLLNGAAGIGCI